MKSYDVVECGAALEMRERPTPVPSGAEVLLRVLAAGVCHTDLHLWEGYYDLGAGKKLRLSDRGVQLPLTMGHENVGEVVAIGSNVRGLELGSRCVVYPWIGCGTCALCRRGQENYCPSPRFIGIFRPGGYGEYLLVPDSRYLLDIGNLRPEQAALYACSGVTVFSALRKLGELIAEEPILIVGAGGLGLMCLSLLKALNGRGAIVAETDPSKRQAALQAGALAAVDSRTADATQQIRAAAGGPLAAVIDFVGAPQTAQLGLDVLRKGGRLMLVGLFGGELRLSLPLIPMRAITIQGSYVGNLGELKELLQLAERRRIEPIPVSARPMADATRALSEMKAGRLLGRAVLVP
jgi:D-arabinose 1-dehydrogenase-like Zn-dependent alcohol dehydrogenase